MRKLVEIVVKPILFNTEMVRAILDGRKIVTRRVVKCTHRNAAGFNVVKNRDGAIIGILEYDDEERSFDNYTVPIYRPGDILYVRETWTRMMNGDYWYKADGKDETDIGLKIKWRPSIHMPREAARIFLRVTNVRVEQLWDITEEDVRREGLENPGDFIRSWDSTIKPADRDRYGWAANPWVFVIEFERCEKPEEEQDV